MPISESYMIEKNHLWGGVVKDLTRDIIGKMFGGNHRSPGNIYLTTQMWFFNPWAPDYKLTPSPEGHIFQTVNSSVPFLQPFKNSKSILYGLLR